MFRFIMVLVKFLKRVVRNIPKILLITSSGIQWVFANQNSKILSIQGNIKSPTAPVRAILLWAKKCEFSVEDENLVKSLNEGFEGDLVLIINCDCKNHVAAKMPADWVQYVTIVRENVGYDWGGYRDFFLAIDSTARQYVTMLNNSVIAIAPISRFIEKQESLAVEIKGITGAVESGHPVQHLQSFSLTFSEKALSGPIINWITATRNVSNKFAMVYFREIRLWGIAKKYELPIEGLITNVGLRQYAKSNLHIIEEYQNSMTYKKVISALEARSLNPTHHLWRFLIELGFPFIKRELINHNPARLPDIDDYIEKLKP